MKPRLYKRAGLWYCRSFPFGLAGLGYTPGEAFAEWTMRNRGTA